MWFQDKASNLFQYAKGLFDAAFVMQVDALGVPLNTTSGGLNTFETAAMGYDPSTGRTPVEMTNNCQFAALTTASSTLVAKSAPGFLRSLSITVLGTLAGATHLALYDNTSASGSALLHVIALPAGGAPTIQVPMDCLFNTGLSIATCTMAGNVATPTNTVPSGSTATVAVNLSYR